MYLDYNRLDMKQPTIESETDGDTREPLEFFSGYGFHICEVFLTNLIETRVDFTKLLLLDTNYKDQLLRYYQQHFQILQDIMNCLLMDLVITVYLLWQ